MFEDARGIQEQSSIGSTVAHQHIEQYVKSGRARLALVKALKAFSRLRSVDFTIQAYHSRLQDQRAVELFTLAVGCLQEVDTSLSRLLISHHLETAEYAYGVLPVWQLPALRGLNLVRLEELRLADGWAFHHNDGSDALLAILRSCSQSLQKLEFQSTETVLWPSNSSVPHMPKLEYISLTSCVLRPKGIATWILRCPKLQRLEMSDNAIRDFDDQNGNSFDLLPIFDALRMHPTKVEYALLNTQALSFPDDRCRLDISITNKDQDQTCDVEPDHFYYRGVYQPDTVISMVKDYISGHGNWHPPTNVSGW